MFYLILKGFYSVLLFHRAFKILLILRGLSLAQLAKPSALQESACQMGRLPLKKKKKKKALHCSEATQKRDLLLASTHEQFLQLFPSRYSW